MDTVTTTVPSGTVTSTATATATRTATVTATRTATVTATRGAGAARTERNGGLAFHDTGISMAPRHTHPVAAAATDTAPRAQLPETGAPSWIYPLLGSGLLLMASGAGMVLASTRRKIRGSHTR